MERTKKGKYYVAGYKDGYWDGYHIAINKLIQEDDAFKEAEEKTKHITDFVLKDDEK